MWGITGHRERGLQGTANYPPQTPGEEKGTFEWGIRLNQDVVQVQFLECNMLATKVDRSQRYALLLFGKLAQGC